MPIHAIGSGGVHANLIHLAYAKIGVRLQSPVKLFHAILSIATVAAPQCDLPVHILRVTAQGVSELDADELT